VIDGERIRTIHNGRIDTIAGTGNPGYSGDGGSARLAEIGMQLALGQFPYASAQGIAVDALGVVYIADNLNNRVRRITRDGLITTVAGNGQLGFSGDGGQATLAAINHPQGIAVDSLGAVYIADTGNNRIRKVDSAGVISTIVGPDSLDHPQGLSLDATGNLYVADTQHHRVVEVVHGELRVIAGTGEPGFTGDGGSAVAARLNLPVAIGISKEGLVYVADSANNRIRRVNAEGRIDTIAGTGVAGYSGDGGPAQKAQLNLPIGVAISPDGFLYVADNLNNRIRQLRG
jgi:sugar lactone lactonase YvrE